MINSIEAPEGPFLTMSRQSTKSPSTSSLFSMADSEYVAWANITFKAWPVEPSPTCSEQTKSGSSEVVEPDNETTATPLSSISISSSISNSNEGADSNKDVTEEYAPHDDKSVSQAILALSHKLERRLDGFSDPEERKTELHRILNVNYNSLSDYHSRQYCAYVYRHPEDIPENPKREQWLDAKIRKPATTCWLEEEEGPFNIEERQQELFGGWSWPKSDQAEDEEPCNIEQRQQELFGGWSWPDGEEPSTAAWPTTEGPRSESITMVANPPRRSTWQDIAIEQRENAAASQPISEAPTSEFVRMVVNPPAEYTWETIVNELQRYAAGSTERTGTESPPKRQRLS